jgi:hypothetical protein
MLFCPASPPIGGEKQEWHIPVFSIYANHQGFYRRPAQPCAHTNSHDFLTPTPPFVLAAILPDNEQSGYKMVKNLFYSVNPARSSKWVFILGRWSPGRFFFIPASGSRTKFLTVLLGGIHGCAPMEGGIYSAGCSTSGGINSALHWRQSQKTVRNLIQTPLAFVINTVYQVSVVIGHQKRAVGQVLQVHWSSPHFIR